MTLKKTIVFVHGAWLTSLSLENFVGYFERQGYSCLAPEWLYRDNSVGLLRQSISPELGQVGIRELTAHYEQIIRALPEPPILIGHSFGGLIVQQLLDRGLGSAGIALDSAAPEGVFPLDWSVPKSTSSVLFWWMNWDKVGRLTFPEFQYAFVNAFPREQQKRYYERYVVPETGRIFFQAAFAQRDPHHSIRVNFKNNDRAPLLLIAGELDHIVPAHVVKLNYEHYEHSTARTDFHEFAGRSHLIASQDGWEEVSGYAANWLDQLAMPQLREPAMAMA